MRKQAFFRVERVERILGQHRTIIDFSICVSFPALISLCRLQIRFRFDSTHFQYLH